MTVVQGSFAATDRTRDPEEQFAEIRQKVVDSLHQTLDSTKHGWLFPTFLVEAVENEVWKHPRRLTHNVVPPMPLSDFVRKPYPVGLGTTLEIIEKLIAGNERAVLAWDTVTRGEHGGAREGAGRKAQSFPEIKPDNIRLENTPPRQASSDYGTSAQSGLRRLEKSAASGDVAASALLHRVVDPKDNLTVHAACVEMGWRAATRTVKDTAEGLSDAVVRKIGPFDTVKQAWRRASQEQREEIAAWVDEQMSPMARSAFR